MEVISDQDRIRVGRQVLLDHADTLSGFLNSIDPGTAEMSRIYLHAIRFVIWLCDTHGIAPYPEDWQRIVNDTWDEVSEQDFMSGVSFDEHRLRISALIDLSRRNRQRSAPLIPQHQGTA